MSKQELMGKVSKIQYFSTGDGEGIRTTVFMQGCNLMCAWCHNPETRPLESVALNYNDNRTIINGIDMSVQQLFDCIIKDEPFYKESNGGVTFSGGEPLLQADYCAQVAKMCKEKGINIIFDTAGSVPYSNFQTVIPYTDTFYFDLKAVTTEDCNKYKCGDIKLVLSNIEKLCQESNVVVRIPIIPGHNFNREKLSDFADVLSKLKPSRVDLLPFHRLGSSKYAAMGLEYHYKNIKPINPTELECFKSIFEDQGLKCNVEV